MRAPEGTDSAFLMANGPANAHPMPPALHGKCGFGKRSIVVNIRQQHPVKLTPLPRPADPHSGLALFSGQLTDSAATACAVPMPDLSSAAC